jgi:hypothetical protein
LFFTEEQAKEEGCSMDGHRESNNHKIDVDKLTKEAEAGHGHYVRSILDRLPFEEQIHIAHEMAQLSKRHNKPASCPEVEFCTGSTFGDMENPNGYTHIALLRSTPNKWFGPLLPPKDELLYGSTLNLTTGEKTATDSDL